MFLKAFYDDGLGKLALIDFSIKINHKHITHVLSLTHIFFTNPPN